MSLRAIKKRENQITTPPGINTNSRSTIFRKLTNKSNNNSKAITQQQPNTNLGGFGDKHKQYNLAGNHIKQQYRLLGRLTKSNNEFGEPSETQKRLEAVGLVRTKSEGDINKLLSSLNQTKQVALLNAKSEVCLKTISTHSYQAPPISGNNNNPITQSLIIPRITSRHSAQIQRNTMLSGARSHRDLRQSSYASSPHNVEISHCNIPPASRRRMSEGNYMRSQRTNSMSNSEMTSSSNTGSLMGHSVPPVDPNSILRIPIIGYEVMEERARFTVYKLRVENPHTNDCWLVLRRYTDFVRLNTKLKQSFPHLTLNLPRKKIFGDNFNSVFLDNRIQGLQMFVNSIMSKEELRKCQLVREFFCLDEPPSYSESMEECRVCLLTTHKLSVTPKVHAVFHHILEFRTKTDTGLGPWSELASESVQSSRWFVTGLNEQLMIHIRQNGYKEQFAIFEAQEETIAHLKIQINTKNDLILQLQQKLREEMQEKEQLKEILKNLNINPTNGNI